MPANLKTAVTLRKAVRELVDASIAEARLSLDFPTHHEAASVYQRADKARAAYERALRKVFDNI